MNLILAAVLLMQDNDAEEAFKKIEEQIEKATTVVVKSHFVLDAKRADTGERLEGPGTLLLKQGNKISFVVKFMQGGIDKPYPILSDGSKATWNAGDKWESTIDTPKNFEAKLRVLFSRAGIVSTPSDGSTPWLFVVQLNNDFKKLCHVSNFKAGPNDGVARTLTYSLVDFDIREAIEKKTVNAGTVDVRLWYDPKTLKPLKRIVTFKKPSSEGTLTETYDEFTLNADIPDEKFKLPDAKK